MSWFHRIPLSWYVIMIAYPNISRSSRNRFEMAKQHTRSGQNIWKTHHVVRWSSHYIHYKPPFSSGCSMIFTWFSHIVSNFDFPMISHEFDSFSIWFPHFSWCFPHFSQGIQPPSTPLTSSHGVFTPVPVLWGPGDDFIGQQGSTVSLHREAGRCGTDVAM